MPEFPLFNIAYILSDNVEIKICKIFVFATPEILVKTVKKT